MTQDLKDDIKAIVPWLVGLVIVVGLLVCFLDGLLWAADICLPPTTASSIVVELEQCRIQKDELAICDEAVFNLGQTIDAQSSEIITCKSAMDIAKQAIEDNKKLQEEQKANMEAQLKIAKPSFFQKLINNATYIGVGIVVGIVTGIVVGGR